TTDTGLISYSATGSVALSLLTTSGNVEITADSGEVGTGAITDNTALETANIIADYLTLSAATGIGGAGDADIDTTITTLSASNSTSGDIFIQETDGLIINAAGIQTSGGSGSIDVDVSEGMLTVSGAVTADGDGNVTLNAAVSTVTLEAAVSSLSGDILITGDTILQNAGGDVITGDAASETGTVTVTADNSNIVMADGTTTTTDTGLISYSATGSVALSMLTTSGNVEVTADSGSIGAGAITDNTALEAANIIADYLTLSAAAGIGAAGDADIDTTITTLSASNSTSGGIFIDESDDLIMGGTGISTQGGDGSIVLVTGNGSMTVSGIVSANGSGNILLATGSTGSLADMTLNVDVISGTGSITLIAYDSLVQDAGTNVFTSGSTIDVEATNGSITMDDNAAASTDNTGNIRYLAKMNVIIGGLNVGTGSASIIAEDGSILDAGDIFKDVTADSLRMIAGTGIGELGASVDPLEITVNTVAGQAGSGGINILEDNDITVDSVIVSVNRVTGDSTTMVMTDASQSDLVTTSDSTIVLSTVDGSITVNDGVSSDNTGISADGSGNILLLAGSIGRAADVILNADVISLTGYITLIARNNVVQNTTADIVTSTGSIYVISVSGSITMADNARASTGDDVSGNIRYFAYTDISVGGLHAGMGKVSIIAITGSILDSGDIFKDVIAESLRMVAGGGIGELGSGNDDPLEIAVGTNTLSARAGSGGINLVEDDDITIGNVVVIVGRVMADGTMIFETDESQSDLVTSSNGSIVLRTLDGGIIINDGTDPENDEGIHADGSGYILLIAATYVDQNSDISSAEGSITVVAASGEIAMADGTTTSTTGPIDYTAGTNIYLSILRSDSTMTVTATEGMITDILGTEDSNIVGTTAILTAATGIGILWVEDIDTTITTLTATSLISGDIYIQETDGLILDFAGIFGGDGWIVISTITGPLTYSDINSLYTTGDIKRVYILEAMGDWTGANLMMLQGMVAVRIAQATLSLKQLGMIWITSPNPDDLFAFLQKITSGIPIIFLVNNYNPDMQGALARANQISLGQFETPQLPEGYSESDDIDFSIETPKPVDEGSLEGTEAGAVKKVDTGDTSGETGSSAVQEVLVRIERTIRTLSAQQSAAFKACYAVLARGNWKVSADQAYKEYLKICKSEQKRPVNLEHFLELIGYLNRRGLINLQINGQHPGAIDIIRSLPEEFAARFL
ncbi:hypothetical protein ACFLZT_02530, partial [Thermodesulfobacteriota bacterium]